MKTVTIDASVVIKWIFPHREKEDHVLQALTLLQAIKKNAIKVIQPIHWLAETTAVVARLQPKMTEEVVSLLKIMQFDTMDEIEIYAIASQLSKKFNHHLFDTLYHAVAIYHGNCEFITADEKYYKKAYKQGKMIRLADFSFFEDG